MSRTLPVFLNLEGRPCLVVGGGNIAWEKAERLIDAGARVTMVAPEVAPVPERLRTADLRIVHKRFEPSDVEEQAVAIAATDDSDVQRAVVTAAREARVPVNVVDQPDLCDFIFGAVLRRGDLAVAVSTGGRFPLLASKLRDRLASVLPHETAAAVEELGRARDLIRRDAAGDIPRLRETLGGLLTDEVLHLIEAADLDTLQQRIREWSSSLTA